MSNTNPVLEVQSVSKSFSGFVALKNLNLQIYCGQVTAITGENGAGKSTLMKIISGVYTTYEGKVFLEREEIHFSGPSEAADKGVIIIHQELNLIPDMTIAENIFLGRELITRSGMLNYRMMNQKAGELLGMLHLSVDPSSKVNSLRVGQQQLVEIARALLYESKVLIMDEPTSAISDQEVVLLFGIIKKLTARGVAVVYISHKMKEIFEISDRYAVLRDGQLIGTGNIADITRDQIIQMMVGRKLARVLKKETKEPGMEVLRVEDLCLRDPDNPDKLRVDHVNFTLHAGEVLGICGLMGSGRSEVLESLFGLFPGFVTGTIFINGKPKQIKNVQDAIREGMALVPEDRKLQGLVLNMTVAMNTSLACLDKISSFGFISRIKEEALSLEFIKKLNIQVSSQAMKLEHLSGGNQQKVVISKWLATNPVILLLDEPTRGIDVGAKAEIYKLIRQLTQQGLAIIVVSSELPEILALSDRILVMSESQQAALLPGTGTDEEIIMRAALIQKKN
jgi:ribose transport system ATP-binding protein